jgi:hypothetical protein
LYKFLGELTKEDNAIVKEEHVEMLKLWALAAGQYAMGSTSHKLAISISPVLNVAPNFTTWLLRQMKHYIRKILRCPLEFSLRGF